MRMEWTKKAGEICLFISFKGSEGDEMRRQRTDGWTRNNIYTSIYTVYIYIYGVFSSCGIFSRSVRRLHAASRRRLMAVNQKAAAIKPTKTNRAGLTG